MDKIEEIKKYKALFDEGEITASEFEAIKMKIIDNPLAENSTQKKSTNPKTTINPPKIKSAGKLIQQSVNNQIYSFISIFVGLVLFGKGFIELLLEISTGHLDNFDSLLGGGFFFLVGFIFWILSLVKMHNAGKLIEQSIKLV